MLSSSSCVSTLDSRLLAAVTILVVIVAYYLLLFFADNMRSIHPAIQQFSPPPPKINTENHVEIDGSRRRRVGDIAVAVGQNSAFLVGTRTISARGAIFARRSRWRVCSHVFRCFSSNRFINQSFPNEDMKPFLSMPN